MAAKYGRVDCSASSYVATCQLCPTFRGAAHTAKVWALADLARHRTLEHPAQATNADSARRARATQ